MQFTIELKAIERLDFKCSLLRHNRFFVWQAPYIYHDAQCVKCYICEKNIFLKRDQKFIKDDQQQVVTIRKQQSNQTFVSYKQYFPCTVDKIPT